LLLQPLLLSLLLLQFILLVLLSQHRCILLHLLFLRRL
jgi:hypothetical protein